MKYYVLLKTLMTSCDYSLWDDKAVNNPGLSCRLSFQCYANISHICKEIISHKAASNNPPARQSGGTRVHQPAYKTSPTPF